MDERQNLHDGEKLLCLAQPSTEVFIRGVLRSIVEAIAIGVLLGMVLWMSGFEQMSWNIAVVIGVLLAVCTIWMRFSVWRTSSFRITTDRILLQYPGGLSSGALKAIKWGRYQESYVHGPSILQMIFGGSNLCIRYGSADGEVQSCYPSLRYAGDIKHYLDKVDSTIRHGELNELRPFVAKPKWKRF